MFSILLVLAISSSLGGLLLGLGVRGYRAGDHPVCRRCGFDLFGTPSSERCGECGTDLTQERAKAIGHHHRRYGLLLAGIFLLIISVGLGATQLVSIDLRYVPTAYVTWKSASPEKDIRSAMLTELIKRENAGSLTATDWDRIAGKAIDDRNNSTRPWDDAWGDLMKKGAEHHHLSDAMWQKYLVCLAHQAFFGVQSRRGDAETELHHRTLDDLLNPQAIEAVAQEVLAYQALRDTPWQTYWGDWLEDARASNQLSADQWKQYLTNIWKSAFTLRLRARVRQGDPLPFLFQFNPTRGGSRPNATPTMQLSQIQLRWEGPAMDATAGRSIPAFTTQLNEPVDLLRYVLPNGFPKSIQPGNQQLHVTATVGVFDDSNMITKPCISTGQIDIPAAFTLLPSDQPSVRIIDSAKWQSSIHESLKPHLYRDNRRESLIDCMILTKHPPLGVGFNVDLRFNGQTLDLGSFACPADSDQGWKVIGAANYSDGDGAIDIILRSSKTAAIESIDTYDVWQGELIYRNVPVISR